MKKLMKIWGIIIAFCFIFSTGVSAREIDATYLHIPETISQEAVTFLQKLKDPNLKSEWPAPDDINVWKIFQKKVEEKNIAKSKPILDLLQPEVKEKKLGGVTVLDIKPRNWKDRFKIIVYTHGGAYTFQSAKSTARCAALMADATGLRVISINYSLAPHAKWDEVTNEVVAVLDALVRRGYSMEDMAIFGDSAGGGLAAASVLKMRDQGKKMPSAVVLWSPWTDITDTGDTYFTLKSAEPFYTYEKHLKNSADAYADPKDQKHPYVSPVYGDYTKGFPPTLIQGGTKEIFLSNFIRQYQALDMAGQTVKLDLYEGMIHVFQVYLYNAPEAKAAMGKVDAFLREHLGE